MRLELQSRCLKQFVVATALFAHNGCHRTTDAIRVETAVEPRPARVGPVTLSLRLANAMGNPLDHARIELEGDMTHPGMSPVFAPAKPVGDGRYRGSLQLTMPGDWVILVHGRLPDGTTVEREIPVKGVQSN